MTRRARFGLAGALLAFFASTGSQAEELRMNATVGTSAEINDNPRLVAGEADPVAGLVVDAAMNFRWGAEAWQWFLAPRVVGRRYTGDYELDSRDVYVNGGYSGGSERNRYDLSASYVRDSTLTSEFSATGVVDENIPRESVGTQASVVHTASERVVLNGRLSYDDVSYDGGIRYRLFDYDYWSVGASAQYSLNEKASVSLISRLARLDVPITGGWSTEQTVGLGLDYAWSERWRMSLSAGPTRSDFRFGEGGTQTSYRAGVSGAWERAQVDFGAERLLSPNAGQGRLQVRDALRASFRYRMRESVALRGFVSGDLYSDVGDRLDARRDDNGTVRAGAAIDWRVSPQWSWRASYTHSRRDVDGSPDGNQFIAGVTWHGWSRSNSL